MMVLIIIFGGTLNTYFISSYSSANSSSPYPYLPLYKASIFPDAMFIPSLLFPFYSPGQLLSIIGQQSLMDSDGNAVYGTGLMSIFQ